MLRKRQKNWVIAITKEKIIAAQVELDKQTVSDGEILEWSKGELQDKSSTLREDLKIKSFFLLLADDLVDYVGVEDVREVVEGQKHEYYKKIAVDNFGTDLEDDLWGYHELNDKSDRVIIYTPKSYLRSEIKQALESSDLIINALEPEVVAKTRNTNPIIGTVLNKDSKILIEKVEDKPEQEDNSSGLESLPTVQVAEKGRFLEKIKAKFGLLFKILITVFLAIVLVAGGYLIYQNNMGDGSAEPGENINSPTQAPEIFVEPTTSSEIINDSGLTVLPTPISAYDIEVLNGSGIPGEAANIRSLLLDMGFEDIDVGNADQQDYSRTEIYLSDLVPNEVQEAIESSLSEDYDVSIMEDTLSEDDEYDIRIIIGNS